jgi:hypothetical protein
VKECFTERLGVCLSACIEGILRLFNVSTCIESSQYYLRNDCDCKAVEGLNIFEKLS